MPVHALDHCSAALDRARVIRCEVRPVQRDRWRETENSSENNASGKLFDSVCAVQSLISKRLLLCVNANIAMDARVRHCEERARTFESSSRFDWLDGEQWGRVHRSSIDDDPRSLRPGRGRGQQFAWPSPDSLLLSVHVKPPEKRKRKRKTPFVPLLLHCGTLRRIFMQLSSSKSSKSSQVKPSQAKYKPRVCDVTDGDSKQPYFVDGWLGV